MRVRSLALAIVALSLSATPAPLEAQARDTLAIGARVRLFGPAIGTITGPVAAVTPDSITLNLARESDWNPETRLRAVPWSAVSRADVSVRTHSHAGYGALVALAAGIAFAECLERCEHQNAMPGLGLMLGLILTVPATGLGALVGANIRHDDWREITPPAGAGTADTVRATGGVVRSPARDDPHQRTGQRAVMQPAHHSPAPY